MSTHKNIDTICISVLAVCILITILFMNGSTLGIKTIIDEDTEMHSGTVSFTENDLNGSWDPSGAASISLNGNSAVISGNGAYWYNGNVIISGSGKYVLHGELTDGSIIVDAHASSKVWLYFDGVAVTCSDDAALQIDQADKVFLTLAEGSDNTLSSGAVYSAEALADRTGGTIYAHDDLTINGSGALTISASFQHGIDANDELVITGGFISINAVSDAIHANEGVRMQGMELAISAGDDGIHCDEGILIAGGTILISSCYEGIEGRTIDVTGGDITIYPSDDGFNANGGSDGFVFDFGSAPFGNPGDLGRPRTGGTFPDKKEMASAGTAGSAEDASKESWLHISGGTITIVNSTARDADGLDSNGDILISGGTIRVSLANSGTNSALDCGSENGGVMEITGGDVIACGSYSMAEGFDASSTQCSILYNISAGVKAGTPIMLEDADGNILLSYEVPCSFSSVVLSCPEMQPGETYLLMIGEKSEEITLDEVSASFGDAQSIMFGGKMNWSGMQDRGRSDGARPGMSEKPGLPPDFGNDVPDKSSWLAPPDLPASQMEP